ncbi:MAG: hybrid sensor histidine kinase/response regulator [Nitrospirae bacterium]|nr:hybrid sensor histidine kinase/response regulator [Nitrospirota bacterium]MBF0592135.1 hybrid sensor histidine kinase/response regulator [Nitrospirota bacterium]
MAKILIIDDEEIIRLSLSDILTDYGYEVITASDGTKGLQLCRDTMPEVVLLDQRMPGISGIETLQGIRALDQDAQVVFITGHAEVNVAVEAIKHGAYDFLVKPVRPDRLLTTIARAIERLRLERQNRELLIQQSKMAAMGEMIGFITHQWKQPLNAIGLIAQDIEDTHQYGQMDTAYLKTSVGEIMGQVTFMSKTMDDFRDFFRPSKQSAIFDAVRAVEDTLSLLSEHIKKSGIDIILNKGDSEGLFYLRGHPNEFKQVLLNIINNARDAILSQASEAGGIPQGRQGKISIALSKLNRHILIAITDNGGGIAEDMAEKLFDPYFTTKGPQKGTGIGLYISKVIIENRMHGGINVRNSDGGAVFTLDLPDAGVEGEV